MSTKDTALKPKDVSALCERLRNNQMSPQDQALILRLAENWLTLIGLLQGKNASLRRLKNMLFGPRTEKKKVAHQDKKKNDDDDKPKPKGHGRRAAKDIPGAKKKHVAVEGHQSGESCPECGKGKLYPDRPNVAAHYEAMPPVQCTVIEMEVLRCNVCDFRIKAPCPPEAAGPKYDQSVPAMIAILRYSAGVPNYRLADLQANLGVPLPAGTQWDILKREFPAAEAALDHLLDIAAQSDLFYNDDTGGTILDLREDIEKECEQEGVDRAKIRTGIYTSAVIAEADGRRIAIFHTGRRHAGETLAEILSRRKAQAIPIQMCDASSRNPPDTFKTILANCLAHGRRKFYDIQNDFPVICEHVIEQLRIVYKNDDLVKNNNLSPHERLAYHQEHSKEIMDDLHTWLQKQFAQKTVEPNSDLGKAVNYMLNHWKPLTLFLEKPGAPLDNNICEQAIKIAIRHRKNSLFYKTENGAHVGDVFMSLIHTCRLNKINAFDYIKQLMKNADAIEHNPVGWMPWNYQETLAAAGAYA